LWHKLKLSLKEIQYKNLRESSIKVKVNYSIKLFFFNLIEELSSEAAENFFDQLGKGPIQQAEVVIANSFKNQNETSSIQSDFYNRDQGLNIQQSSFINESGTNIAGKGVETVKSQVGKAIPVKKKKGALPTNMFD